MRGHGALYCLIALAAGLVGTQSEVYADDQPAAAVDRVSALEAELAKQRAELEALRAELKALHASKPVANAAAGPDAQASQPSSEAAEDPELAQFLAEAKAEAAVPSVDEPTLKLYGFADVGVQRIWADREVDALAPETEALTFVLGNVNLYLDAAVAKNWRFLAEMRFGLGPDGSVPRPKGGYGYAAGLDTSVSDPSAANGGFTNLKWAGVVPQRAHIDWTPSDAFSLRAGLFLTPYGIWNVDHGTPTRIMASEPVFLSTQLIPNQLVGLQAYGTLPALPWTIGYHVHVSNGRTVGQVDLTDNKAVGGRLFVTTRDPFPIKLGVSGYWGTSEDETRTFTARTTNYAFTEYAVSGDVSLDIGSLRIRSEVVTSWTVYEDGKRRELLGVPLADTMRMGTYLMLAYQLPWYGIEPLIMTEWLRIPIPRNLPVGEGVIMPSVGVNVYFTPSTMLRTQFAVAHGLDFSEHPVHTSGFLYQGAARLITAF